MTDPHLTPDRPHPGLRLRRVAEGCIEVRLDGFDLPIARAERLHDGTWVAAVRPLQTGPEKAIIVADESVAVARLKPWCRQLAWRYRPMTRAPGSPRSSAGQPFLATTHNGPSPTG